MLDWAELAIALSGSRGDVDTALRRYWTAMFERIAPVAQGVGADVVDVFRRLRPRIWLVLRLTDRRCTRRY
jgi:hypothetical protein